MQKIEKWRIEELGLVLNELSFLLKLGESSEWANVFSHFNDESQKIVTKKEFDLDSLNKLVRNIKNCFFKGSSFTDTLFRHENPKEETKLNQILYLIKARLLKILTDMENNIIEYIN